jgi:hypothetical protein
MDRKWVMLIVALSFIAMGFALGVISSFALGCTKPQPIRAFRQHESIFKKYAAAIRQSPPGKNRTNCPVPQALADVGVTGVVRVEDGSVCLLFCSDTLPTDSTPYLIYCPTSQNDLRAVTPVGGSIIIKGELIDRDWFYCEADI